MRKIAIGFGSITVSLLLVFLVFSSDIINSGRGQASSGSDTDELAGLPDTDNEIAAVDQATVEGVVGNPKIIQREFKPSMIEFYTGRPMKFEQYTLDDVKPSVYVNGVDAHSGHGLTIYSKVNKNTFQTIRLKLEEEVLKVFVREEQAVSEDEAEQNKVLQTLLKEMPTHFEVYKNGVFQQKEKIMYAIE